MKVSVLFGRTTSVLRGEDAAMLNPVERARASRFRRDADRDDFIAAHLLLRRCVAGLLDLDVHEVDVVQSCDLCGGVHGRPELAQDRSVPLSLAHAGGYVAVAAGGVRLGVDVENRATGLVMDAASGVLSAAEYRWVRERGAWSPDRFLQLWVRKEAIVKAGLASLDALPSIDLVANGRMASQWAGMPLTGWDQGDVIGACLSTSSPTIVNVDSI